MPEQIGDISNLISKSGSRSQSLPKELSRIDILEDRVARLEVALEGVVKELTALRAAVQRKPESPTPKAIPTEVSKTPASEPKPPPKKKRKLVQPWDNPNIRRDLEACRPKILELLRDGAEITKAGCAETLDIDATLAGRTLSYLMTQTKEITMISPPPTQDDPDPKKRFRLK